MQERNKQLQPIQHQSDIPREIMQINEPPTFVGLAKNRIISKYGMTEQAWAIYEAEISIGLLTLRTAFPTQARNYSDKEHDMLTALWMEIFTEIESGTLREAIMRFISADRKGFFPSPGQIMGIAEEIIAEREAERKRIATEKHWESVRQHESRVKNGENCSTCRFCVTREVKKFWNKNETEPGLFCQNPESYKYEGEHGYGTVESILCDYYEPRENENTEGEENLVE